MKNLLALVICLASHALFAQGIRMISFDPGDTLCTPWVEIDTMNYHRNNWQIGRPHKTVFTSSLTIPNAIVTDTVNPYLSNDTSVFNLKIPQKQYLFTGVGYDTCPLSVIEFKFQLNIDSNSIARVEFSEDSGFHWFNLQDTLPTGYYWLVARPDLSISTISWTPFTLARPVYGPSGDSTIFRFTFISGSNTASKEGWIIDNIVFNYYAQSIPQLQTENLISIYPNPTKGNIYIHSNRAHTSLDASIFVYDMLGREVYRTNNVTKNCLLQLQLPEGIYSLKYLQENEYCVKRLLIEK